MASSYPAVIELRVDGITHVTRVLDSITKLDNALISIKKTPLAIDSKKAVDGIRVLKKEVDDFVFKLGQGTVQLAATTAGINAQASAFKALAANAKLGGTAFNLYVQAAEQARQKTFLKGGLAEIAAVSNLYKIGKTAPNQSFKGVDELIKFGAAVPKNTASLELYKAELISVLNVVNYGTEDYAKLGRAIADVNRQLQIGQGFKPLQIPATPAVATGEQYAGQFVGPRAAPGTRLAAGLSSLGLGTLAKGIRKGRVGTALGEAVIGGAFPLLFGQGPEAALGGGIGGFLGGLIGGPYGFALSLAGTVLGEKLGEPRKKLEEQQTQAITAGELAQKSLQELQNRREQSKIEQQIYDIRTKTLGTTSLQAKRDEEILQARAEARKQRQDIARDPSVDVRISQELLKQTKLEENRNILLINRAYQRESELQGAEKLYTIERNRLSMASTMLSLVRDTATAGLSAAQAIGSARTARLERLAAGAADPVTQANLQAQAAQETAAAARRVYEIRLLDIELAQLQLRIEQKVQESKLAQAVAQAKIAKAQGATVEALQAYNEAIRAQQDAVSVARAAVLAGEAKSQYAQAQAAAEYSQQLQGVVEKLDRASDIAAKVGDNSAARIRDLALETDKASQSSLALAESWFRVGSAISSAVNAMARSTLSTANITRTAPAGPAAPVPLEQRSYAEVNGVRTYFAEGGFVTRPTNALIGEGGESEYVIPTSKMSSAMQRYSAGIRGEAVTAGAVTTGGTSTANYSNQQNAYYGGGAGASVNITTGPVIRMNDRDYVSMTDLQRGMAVAANAGRANMMRQLGRSYAARRSMGL